MKHAKLYTGLLHASKKKTYNNSELSTEENLKQSWLPAFWKKKIQNTQEIKRTLFN